MNSIEDVKDEVNKVNKKYGPYNSTHEGYAVVLEELDELWDEIKNKDKNLLNVYTEAKHVACTAVRLMQFVEKELNYEICEDCETIIRGYRCTGCPELNKNCDGNFDECIHVCQDCCKESFLTGINATSVFENCLNRF